MTTLKMPMCYSCIHQHEDRSRCDAFPAGIPREIMLSRYDHRKPHEDDNGIRFKQDPGRPEPDPPLDRRFGGTLPTTELVI